MSEAPTESSTAKRSIPDGLRGPMAGFAAGLATLLVGQPFDTLKVRLQTSSTSTLWYSVTQCLRNEGVAGLYKGTSPQILGAAVQHGVRYGRWFCGVLGMHLHSANGSYANAKQALKV